MLDCLLFAATFGSLSYLIWNYWAKDSLELSKSVLKLKRDMPLFSSRFSNYQKSEVKNLHLMQPDEKPGLFEGVFGLRLFMIQYRGVIAFETPQGMIVRFGWGLSNSEAEEIVAIIKNWLEESAVWLLSFAAKSLHRIPEFNQSRRNEASSARTSWGCCSGNQWLTLSSRT